MTSPPIILTRRDLARLDSLLGGATFERLGKTGAFLVSELARAQVVHDSEIAHGVVTMGAAIHFRDDDTGEVSQATLIYPGETAHHGLGISVLTPAGAALIGLSEGQSIAYETPDGRLKSITVMEVGARCPA
jgi:regulator of nucleoside diphosphate kinase